MTEKSIYEQAKVTDKPGEECGVFGMYDFDGSDVSGSIYYGLLALQHRGQESCGIAVSDTSGPKGKVLSVKDMGLVNEAFNPENLEKLKGDIVVWKIAPVYARSLRSSGAFTRFPLCASASVPFT